jgi:hypothetical protein
MSNHFSLRLFPVLLCALALLSPATAAPPAPTLLNPANGASLTEPLTLSWSAVSDPTGINFYVWEVNTTSTFTTTVARGFTPPATTQVSLSGLVNGTYFWHVNVINGAGVQSPFSPARSFTIIGQAPGTLPAPSFTKPANNAQFHPYEFFDVSWTSVPGAASYRFEDSQDPNFDPPQTTAFNPTGTTATLGFGFTGTIFVRVRTVGADGTLSLPSPTLRVSITYNAPIPPPPTLVSPANGATVTLPITFDWTDDPNPQIGGYELWIDKDPTFPGGAGLIELTVTGITPSLYTLTSLARGTHYWKVRAHHGDASPTAGAVTAFSAVRSFTIPPSPPALLPLILSATTLGAGDFQSIGILLDTPAPPGGLVATLSSSNTAVATPPATVTFTEGNDFANGPVSFPTGQVTVDTPVTITVTLGSSSQSATFTVVPPSLKRLDIGTGIGPQSVTGGGTITGTVLLNGRAPAGGAVVALTSSDATAASVPTSVTVPEGAPSISFSITTGAVPASTNVSLTASWKGQSVSASLTVVKPSTPTSLVIDPTSVTGGNPATAAVVFSTQTPPGGQAVHFTSSNSFLAFVPDVTAPGGVTAASTTVTTRAVASPTPITITATTGGVTVSGTLTLLPVAGAPPPPPVLSSLTLSPTSVTGGGAVQGTATLSAAAPSGGLSVSLTSGDTTVATVPASVTVPAGATSATFTVTSKAVPAATTVVISGKGGGVFQSAVLNVTPGAAPPPPSGPLPAPSLQGPAADARFAPGQTVTFTWSAVSGAASYTLQIDDSSSFTTPLIVNQTVTAATYSTSTLPTTTLWWRVRANDAAGNPGAWATVRRFEVKN